MISRERRGKHLVEAGVAGRPPRGQLDDRAARIAVGRARELAIELVEPDHERRRRDASARRLAIEPVAPRIERRAPGGDVDQAALQWLGGVEPRGDRGPQ